MNKIGLVVDEGADLPKEIIEKYQIEVVPLKMEWPDIEGLAGENTFQKMREAEKRGIKSFGKTSQPSPKDFLTIFKKQLQRFEKILTITITSKHSGTYNSACQARNFLEPARQEKVFVLDSLNGSAGQGLLVLKAIDLIEKGERKIEEIFKELENFRPKIVLRGILKDPKWLEASGRISSTAANLIRKMEKIGLRPILGVKNGVIKVIGIKTRAKDIPTALFNEFREKAKNLLSQNKKIRAVITHGDNLEMAQRLKEMIGAEFKEVEISFINLIDNVLGVIVGPDALVLAWSPLEI
jgi:DegV family protein with EDD domain